MSMSLWVTFSQQILGDGEAAGTHHFLTKPCTLKAIKSSSLYVSRISATITVTLKRMLASKHIATLCVTHSSTFCKRHLNQGSM